MLVTLNTHYRGATYAEAFNGNGKTSCSDTRPGRTRESP